MTNICFFSQTKKYETLHNFFLGIHKFPLNVSGNPSCKKQHRIVPPSGRVRCCKVMCCVQPCLWWRSGAWDWLQWSAHHPRMMARIPSLRAAADDFPADWHHRDQYGRWWEAAWCPRGHTFPAGQRFPEKPGKFNLRIISLGRTLGSSDNIIFHKNAEFCFCRKQPKERFNTITNFY